MNYPNGQVLGERLAARLNDFCNNETIVICLNYDSLISCLELAARLHAYIYVLQYATIRNSQDETEPVGLMLRSGTFVENSSSDKNNNNVEAKQQEALLQLKNEPDYNLKFDRAIFNERNVLLFAEQLQTTLPVQLALEELRPYKPKMIFGAFGNITTPVFELMQQRTEGCIYMDIISPDLSDKSNRPEDRNNFTKQEIIQMANNISLYWAQKERN